MHHHLRTLFAIAPLFLASVASAEETFEREPALAAVELVQPALLAGPHFQVQPYAQLQEMHARFVLETDWGAVDAASVELLAARVAEMPWVELLNSESVMTALADAGVDSIRNPISKAARIGKEPLNSLARVPGGLVNSVTQRIQRIGDHARRIGHRTGSALLNEGSPNSPSPKSGATDESPWWDGPVDEVGRLLRSEAGHGKARRDIAAALELDSRTPNPLLRQRLDELAWAMASGRIASERMIDLLSAGASRAISLIGDASKLTAEAEPENLRRLNEARIGSWTADDTLAYRLAWRSGFLPEQLGQLLDAIDAIQASGGQQAMLEVASLARSELDSRLLLNSIELLREQNDLPVDIDSAGSDPGGPDPAGLEAAPDNGLNEGEFLPLGKWFAFRTAGNELLVPLAVDRISWTEDTARWFDQPTIGRFHRRTLIVAGSISPAAERALTLRGWSLRQHVRWSRAPPYRRPGDAA